MYTFLSHPTPRTSQTATLRSCVAALFRTGGAHCGGGQVLEHEGGASAPPPPALTRGPSVMSRLFNVGGEKNREGPSRLLLDPPLPPCWRGVCCRCSAPCPQRRPTSSTSAASATPPPTILITSTATSGRGSVSPTRTMPRSKVSRRETTRSPSQRII